MQLGAGVQPEGWPARVKLLVTYELPGQRAVCIWKADKPEILENMFMAMMEVFPAETKITPIIQLYPPSPDLYKVITNLFKATK